MRIDLSKYKSPKSTLFTGRPQGEKVREKIDLDAHDKSEDKILFVIPSGTSSINPSFFLGLFYPSIKKMGLDRFNNKYIFEFEEDNENIVKILKGHIEDALRNARNSLSNTNSLSFFLRNKGSKSFD